jgi:Na+/alanine symporter
MNNVIYIIFILFSLLPAVHLAKQKNFLFIENKKNNIFLIRFLFLLPGILAMEFLFYLVCFIFISVLGLSWMWVMIMSIPISILIIIIFKPVLRTDPPFENQYKLDEYDLYMLIQNKREIEDSFFYKGTGEKRQGYVVAQVKEISANFSKMKRDIIFTERGELIVSTRALSVFQSNCLTGYTTKYVIDKKSKQKSDSYFQLVADELMPLSSKTEFKKGFFGSILIAEDRAYYSHNILETAADFNRTAEYLGDNTGFPYYH